MSSTASVAQPPPNAVLREVFTDKVVHHPDGRILPVVGQIAPTNSWALYQVVRARRPELVVEIGMAYGISTLSILTALEENQQGRMISIDPYIGWPTGREVALHQIERAGLSHRHEHWQESSYLALARLIEQGTHPGLIYIDGNHNFDYAFTDCFLGDKALGVGGVLAFNDSGWRSVFRVIGFLQKYRRYRELDVGLARRFDSRNALFSLIKRIQGRSSADRYFEKLEDWEPSPSTLTIPGP